jgi:hypothetical protein
LCCPLVEGTPLCNLDKSYMFFYWECRQNILITIHQCLEVLVWNYKINSSNPNVFSGYKLGEQCSRQRIITFPFPKMNTVIMH